LREWEALETEHQRLGDWRTQLEERTKVASCQFASERSELEQEREDFKEDLEKVFDREREVARKEKGLVKKEELLNQREAVITEFHEKLKAYNVMLEKQRDEQTTTEAALQKLWRELDDRASNLSHRGEPQGEGCFPRGAGDESRLAGEGPCLEGGDVGKVGKVASRTRARGGGEGEETGGEGADTGGAGPLVPGNAGSAGSLDGACGSRLPGGGGDEEDA
jgi:hypothetical protein